MDGWINLKSDPTIKAIVCKRAFDSRLIWRNPVAQTRSFNLLRLFFFASNHTVTVFTSKTTHEELACGRSPAQTACVNKACREKKKKWRRIRLWSVGLWGASSCLMSVFVHQKFGRGFCSRALLPCVLCKMAHPVYFYPLSQCSAASQCLGDQAVFWWLKWMNE